MSNEAHWFTTNRITIKARAADTGGAFGLIEAEAPAGASPPLHVHHREDESFFVLEGDAPARFLNVITPGGFEQFFADAGRPAEGPGLPPMAPPDIELLGRVSAEYDSPLIGPPLSPSAEAYGAAFVMVGGSPG